MEKACSTNNFKLVIAEKVAELWEITSYRERSENSNLHWGPSTQARVCLQSGPKIQEVPDKKNQNLLKNTNS